MGQSALQDRQSGLIADYMGIVQNYKSALPVYGPDDRGKQYEGGRWFERVDCGHLAETCFTEKDPQLFILVRSELMQLGRIKNGISPSKCIPFLFPALVGRRCLF